MIGDTQGGVVYTAAYVRSEKRDPSRVRSGADEGKVVAEMDGIGLFLCRRVVGIGWSRQCSSLRLPTNDET